MDLITPTLFTHPLGEGGSSSCSYSFHSYRMNDDNDDDKDDEDEENEEDDIEDVELFVGRGAHRAARDKERDCGSYHPNGKH